MRLILNPIVCILIAFSISITAQSPDIKELMINSGDVELFVRVAGEISSDNVLLGVHGGPGGSCDYMLNLEQLCSDNCTVVNYDQRGSGKSGTPFESYSLDKFAQDIEAIRTELDINKFSLFGHSWGGVVSLYYAAKYPEHVDKIILMGSGPTNKSIVDKAQQNVGIRAAELMEKNIIPAELPEDPLAKLKAVMPVYYSDPNYDAPYEVKNMYYKPEVSSKIINDLGTWNFDDKVAKLEHKVLILWGEDDPFGTEMGKYNYNQLKSADVSFELLKNCGHYWHECEEHTMKLLKTFLVN